MDFEPLTLLLKAPSKEVVNRICNESFKSRHATTLPDDVIKSSSEALEIQRAEVIQLHCSLSSLIKDALFKGTTNVKEIQALFPGDFHANLRDLLVKVFIGNMPSWKQHAMNNLVSLPRLVDFDWRVDTKTSSDNLSRMAVPTCLLQLQVEENMVQEGEPQIQKSINVELSKETLETMLDGLGKIRDQLNSVATRQT